MATPTYTREEMDAILRRALERQQERADGIGHDELVDAAAEVGIPREEVEAAAQELEATRLEGREMAEARTSAIQRLSRGAVAWAAFSVVFATLGAVLHRPPFFMPILFWGIAVAIRAFRVLVQNDYGRLSRRERRQRRREERRQEFDQRVQVGADALVRVLEEMRRVRERTPEQVAQAKAKAARVRMKVDFEPMTPTRLHTTPTTPRARVTVEEEADAEDAKGPARGDGVVPRR